MIMSFLHILFLIFINPVQLIYDLIFSVALKISGNYIFAISVLTIIVVLLVLLLVLGKIVPGKLLKPNKFSTKLLAKVKPASKQTLITFTLATLIDVLLLSFCIPSVLIVSSVQEFVDPFTYENPLKYIFPTVCIALGVFVVWGGAIYYLLGPKGKRIFAVISIGLSLYLYFNFFYAPMIMDKIVSAPVKAIAYFFVLILMYLVLIAAYRYSKFIFNTILVAALVGAISLGVVGTVKINEDYNNVNFPPLDQEVSLNLSRDGNNVIVIMLDRALGVTVMDEFEMIPGLQDRYDGFTYYPNTVSFGAHTNIASPALLGGYEYTPYMINQRSDETLRDKQNEAVCMLPMMFSNANYESTVINPIYAGYQNVADTSVLSDIPNTNAYVIDNYFNDYAYYLGESINATRERDLFMFSISYALIYGRDFFFDNGNYHNPNRAYYSNFDFDEFLDIKGEVYRTANDYNVLRSLENITSFDSDLNGSYIFINNTLTHGETIPFLSDVEVDFDLNAFYNLAQSRSGDNEVLFESYMSNGIALELLGEWFDYLRSQGVYDNTRIIIVSDHGFNSNYLEDCIFADDNGTDDVYGIENYIPVLLVKDFDSTGFTVSEDFATNADVPYIATLGVIDNPVNPFTGNPIINHDGFDMPLRISFSHRFNIEVNNGNVFMETDSWYDITDTDDLFDVSNWSVIYD